MTPLSDEAKLVIIQLFIDERDKTGMTIHPKRKEKRRKGVLKELHGIQHDFEKVNIGIDLEPYQQAEVFLVNLEAEQQFFEFVDDLLSPYLN